MSEQMKPALTPEEWDAGFFIGAELALTRARVGIDGRSRIVLDVMRHPVGDPSDLHAVAAFALHGQAFGYTWEDVDALVEAGEDAESVVERMTEAAGGAPAANVDPNVIRRQQRHASSLRDIGARIAALLPPREPTEGQ